MQTIALPNKNFIIITATAILYQMALIEPHMPRLQAKKFQFSDSEMLAKDEQLQ
jgi:hypothetical protein